MNSKFLFIIKSVAIIVGIIILLNLISLRYKSKVEINDPSYKPLKILYTPKDVLDIVLPYEDIKL